MLKIIKKVSEHPFLASSLVMVLGTNIYNFGQFAYHFITARFLEQTYGGELGKSYYGDVATMISVMGLIGIAQLAMGLTVVKFIATAKDEKSLTNLVKWIYYWTTCIGVVILVITLAISPFLGDFLHISNRLALYLLAPTLMFFMIINSGRSILQGTLSFGKYVLSLISEVGFKIVFTLLFILTGLAVVGVMSAILVGIFFAFLLTTFFLSKYLRGERGPRPEVAPIIKYSIPVLLQGLALTSMYSTDLLLVKHFFTASEAGIYAALTILGRVVFFAVSPITHVMFPLIAKRHSHGTNYHGIFYLSLLIVTALVFSLVSFYYLFPALPISVLYGATYLDGAPLLWLAGLFMGLLAIAMLFTQFYLSIGKTFVVMLFIVASVLQIILIWIRHDTLLEVVQASIISAALLVFSLLVYFPYHHSSPRK